MEQLKIIFMHIPKNAGTSFKEWCAEYHVKRIIHNLEFNNMMLKNWRKYIENKGKTMFAFCVCRNPYDRLVSLYHYYIQSNKQEVMAKKKHCSLTVTQGLMTSYATG